MLLEQTSPRRFAVTRMIKLLTNLGGTPLRLLYLSSTRVQTKLTLLLLLLQLKKRLWSKVTAAIKTNNLEAATDAKTEIEDAQREATREREEKGETWKPRFFELRNGEYRPAFT